mmetsp:Transcript_1510/g.3363  ORF Transcript_1510/g.3363 Transcript_1510/m.3363 type:complete len:239 (-) Transcript_1510:367-1083(-)
MATAAAALWPGAGCRCMRAGKQHGAGKSSSARPCARLARLTALLMDPSDPLAAPSSSSSSRAQGVSGAGAAGMEVPEPLRLLGIPLRGERLQLLHKRVREVLDAAHNVRIPDAPDAAGNSGRGSRGVHGDMREPNILVKLPCIPGDGQHSGSADSVPAEVQISSLPVKFVDFDWSGIENVARYPPFLNRAVPWPQGVESGQRLSREHDVELLQESLFPRRQTWPWETNPISGLKRKKP